MLSLVLLNQVAQGISLGTAYAVWTSNGAFGTARVGILLFRDPADFGRVVFLVLLIIAIIGLKLVTFRA